MGAGSIIMNIIVPLIISFIIGILIQKVYESGYELPFDLPGTLNIDTIYSIIEKFIEEATSGDYKSSKLGMGYYSNELILSYIGNILALCGIIITLYSAGLADPSGSTLAALAVGLSVWALPYYALGIIFVQEQIQLIFGAIGLIFSIPSLLSIVGIVKFGILY